MKRQHTLLGALIALGTISPAHAQLGVDQHLGTDLITFGSFEGYGDNDGQNHLGSFMPEMVSGGQNFGGFTAPPIGSHCWESSRWPDLVRYYWRYYQSTPNNNTGGSSNVAGRLIHRLHTGNVGMSNALNGPSWNNSIWNNQYLSLTFYGPNTPAHMVLYQELRTLALPGNYDFEMHFRPSASGMRVRLYGTAQPKVSCISTNGVANQIVPGNLLYDSGALTGTNWQTLTAALTTTSNIASVLIQVSMADGSAPLPNTTVRFDDIHWYSNDCTPRWTEPQSARNTYGTVSTGDLCALLDRAITADGSPDHMMLNELRILCGLDGCPPPCDPSCPLDLDGSGTIDQPDIDILESLFGSNTSAISNPCHLGADANGDGAVSVADLLLFIAAFGSTCDGSGMRPEAPGAPTYPTARGLVVLPNPSNGLFTLFADVPANSVVDVLSADGRAVKSLRTNELQRLTIDLTSEASGIYLVRVNNAAENMLRVVKE